MFGIKKLRERVVELEEKMFCAPRGDEGERQETLLFVPLIPKDRDLANRVKELEEKMSKPTETTECEVCGCLIKKEDRFAVEMDEIIGGYIWMPSDGKKKEYYCLAHKPPYNRIEDGKYYKDNVEVDKKGRVKSNK